MDMFIFLGSIVFAALGGYAYGKSVGKSEGAEIAAAEMSAVHRRYRLVPKVDIDSFADSTH